MAADGWTAIKTGPDAHALAARLARELAVPGMKVTDATVFARAVVVGLEEIDRDNSRFHSPPSKRRKKRSGQTKHAS